MQRGVEGGAADLVALQGSAGTADGDHLGVGGGVVAEPDFVVALGDDPAVQHQDAAGGGGAADLVADPDELDGAGHEAAVVFGRGLGGPGAGAGFPGGGLPAGGIVSQIKPTSP